MRIIAGYARGMTLSRPRQGVRPTTDRVRESLFASLEPILDHTVVDLFAGTGALGLESLSRGAAAVYWIERDRRTCKQIETDLARIQTAIVERKAPAKVLCGDALSAPNLLPGVKPDIILADPPYNPEGRDKGGADLLISPSFHAWAGAALLVLEQSHHSTLPKEAFALWTLDRQKRYGDTVLYYLRAK